MGAYTPSVEHARADFERALSGQQLCLVIVEGSGDSRELYSCIHRQFPTQLDNIRQEAVTLPDGSKIAFGTNAISEGLANEIASLSATFTDALYTAGFIDETTPTTLAWPMAIKQMAERGLHGSRLYQVDDSGCTVSVITGAESLTFKLLNMLESSETATKAAVVLPDNPTSEQQTCKKSTRRNGNKADKWLKRLESVYRKDITNRLRESGYDPKPKEIESLLTKEVRSKGRDTLRDMIAALSPLNGEDPPTNLTIKESRSEIFDSWRKHRSTPGRKRGAGCIPKMLTDADGLAVRKEGEGFQEHTDEAAASDALTAFYNELLKDPASVDKAAAMQEFKILLKRQGSALDAGGEIKKFSEFLDGLKATQNNVDI